MRKKIVWGMVSGLMVLSLVMAACGPAPAEEEKGKEAAPVVKEEKAKEEKEAEEKGVVEKEVVSPEAPKYGGTLNLVGIRDILYFDDIDTIAPGALLLTKQHLWEGDWAKGPAGGYGTNETDWAGIYDLFSQKAGMVAESTKWTVDEEKNEGTIVYQIRQGIHWALNPDSEASRLVGGRELTADDVVFHLRRVITERRAYIYRANPELRVAEITKTGPWEVTVKLPLDALITGITRFGNSTAIQPSEVIEKYGDMADWRNNVGSGPFMLTDYVAGSAAMFVKNPNYWGKDPVGPGKGNQLPYLDGVRYLIIPDASTQQAALRTGKIDQMAGISWEDAILLRKTNPELLEQETLGSSLPGLPSSIGMRTDRPPFNDVRVRRAMMMATDFQAIVQGLFGGRGYVLTWPAEYRKTYADLYLGLDDPEMPESVKELYTYNPEKAKELLAEAGYPDGFKTEALMTSDQVDYYSIIKDMWAKVGVDLEFNVRERGAYNAIVSKREYKAIVRHGGGHVIAIFYVSPSLRGKGSGNTSLIDDPVINEALDKIRRVALTDMREAMRMYKELMKYVLDQAYAIPTPRGYSSTFWWPWLKNYSGEGRIGYRNGVSWPQWVWLDQELKKSMGY